MWYLIGIVAAVLLAFFLVSMHKHKNGKKAQERPTFRSERDLETYEKKMDAGQQVDSDDME